MQKTLLLTLLILVATVASAQWSTNPSVYNPICTASGVQANPVAVSDGASGVIVAWVDERNLATSGRDIYAQRLNASGNRVWSPADGVPICTALEDQGDGVDRYQLAIVSDGAGGAIITWKDKRGIGGPGPSLGNIFAQRITSSGTIAWPANGIPVCTAANEQKKPFAVSYASGCIILWEDLRSGISGRTDMYAQ